MTAADKLRELLASRPALPGTEALVRWWRTSAELVPVVLDELDSAERGFARLQMQTREQDEALDDARAKLRREQDARAELRVELDRVTACLKKANENHEEFERRWYLASDELERVRGLLASERAAVEVVKQEVRELEQQREAARAAARALVARVADLGAFADDNDPRVMATAAPLGAAQADLWLALGLNPDDELARMQADIESRCAVCGWPLAESADQGCVRGCCSMRPRPEKLYAPERAKREAEDLHERALRNGMPPSGRWA